MDQSDSRPSQSHGAHEPPAGQPDGYMIHRFDILHLTAGDTNDSYQETTGQVVVLEATLFPMMHIRRLPVNHSRSTSSDECLNPENFSIAAALHKLQHRSSSAKLDSLDPHIHHMGVTRRISGGSWRHSQTYQTLTWVRRPAAVMSRPPVEDLRPSSPDPSCPDHSTPSS